MRDLLPAALILLGSLGGCSDPSLEPDAAQRADSATLPADVGIEDASADAVDAGEGGSIDAPAPTDAPAQTDASVTHDAFVTPDAPMTPDALVVPDAFVAPDAYVVPDAGTPSRADLHVHIEVDNTCRMTVTPREISVPPDQTLYLDWHNHSRDYPVDVWMSYGGGYTDLMPGATWDEPIGHCGTPFVGDEYADISTACSSFRFLIHCR